MCGCLVVAFGAMFPRVALVVLWVLSDWIQRAFSGEWVVPLLGLLFTWLSLPGPVMSPVSIGSWSGWLSSVILVPMRARPRHAGPSSDTATDTALQSRHACPWPNRPRRGRDSGCAHADRCGPRMVVDPTAVPANRRHAAVGGIVRRRGSHS